MPFASQAQARFLFAKNPAVAREFASKTPDIKSLPQHLASAQQVAKTIRKKK